MKRKKVVMLFGSVILVSVMGLTPFFSARTGTALAAEPFKLTLTSLPAGFAAYSLSVALADMINKDSTWLRATAVEGRGPVVPLKMLAKDPKKRKDLLFFLTPWEIWQAKKQIGPFKGLPFDYDKFRYVCLVGWSIDVLYTLDPKIKTIKDIRGKRIVVDAGPGRTRLIQFKGIFKAAGIADEVKFEYMTGKAAADAVRDGLIGVAYAGASLWKPPNTWAPSPFTAELVASKDVYFISTPEKYIKAMMQETGFPSTWVALPPKTMGPLQTEPCIGLTRLNAWAAHIDMPDHVVTEILRVAYRNADKFKEYVPAGEIITKKNLAAMGVSEDRLHPAALNFYEEKSIPIASPFK